MGASFEVYLEGRPLPDCRAAAHAAFTEIARLEQRLSVYRSDSEISDLNRRARAGWTPVHPDLLQIISRARHLAEVCDGAYDPTLGALIDLWGFGPGGDRTSPPSPDEIAMARMRTGFRHLIVQNGGIERQRDGMTFNFGGIGKGYAIDRAVAILQSFDLPRGFVHCGSTTRVFGEEGFPVDIRHPREPEKTLGEVEIQNAAIATSGDSERYFVAGGQRFGHLIDGRSGFPASAARCASVIAPTAAAADALSTAAFVRGEVHFLKRPLPTGGATWDNPFRSTDVEGWVMRADGGCAATPGWVMTPHTTRRRFLATAAGLLLWAFLPKRSEAATVYLTEEEALRTMMPTAERFETEAVTLSDAQRAAASDAAGRPIQETAFSFRVGRGAAGVVGYGLALEVIGKARPITFLIGIDPAGAALGVEVLVYRESQGSEVRHRRFTGQFAKKSLGNRLRLGDDIQPISGATLSSRAATYAVRKALAVFSVTHPA